MLMDPFILHVLCTIIAFIFMINESALTNAMIKDVPEKSLDLD